MVWKMKFPFPGGPYSQVNHLNLPGCSFHVWIGTLLQFMDVVMTDGSTKQIGYVHPLAFLWWIISHSKHFAQFFNDRLRASGVQPWDGIIYADEVTPGNVLRRKNNRKCWTIYMAFVESPYLGFSLASNPMANQPTPLNVPSPQK